MKISIRVRKKAFFLAIILALLVTGMFMVFGKAIVNEFTDDVNQFKKDIQASPNECWKKPAQNRKNAVCNKLTELQQLITEENFEEAYDKLLHDIKPKLTGLKQDEHEISWGNGVYNQPWVICSDLQAIYLDKCDSILSQINPLSVYDDIPPLIDQPEDIAYEYISTGNKITWTASDEHPDTYIVLLDGEFYEDGIWVSGVPVEIDIDGLSLGSYQFSIEFYDTYLNYAVDNVNVVVTEDDDTSPPTINIQYLGANDQNKPGIWIVVVEDLDSGIDKVQIIVDGNSLMYNYNGETLIDLCINVPGAVGFHTIEVIATNNDNDWENDQETATMTDSVYINPYVPPPPPIYNKLNF